MCVSNSAISSDHRHRPSCHLWLESHRVGIETDPDVRFLAMKCTKTDTLENTTPRELIESSLFIIAQDQYESLFCFVLVHVKQELDDITKNYETGCAKGVLDTARRSTNNNCYVCV